MLIKDMSFSVLSSVYFKESPEFLEQCFSSVFNQSIQHSEFILVHDGPLTVELYSVISFWKTRLNIVEVVLPHNMGLGKALNEGLKFCNNEYVFRVDTDDISFPERFEVQLNYMNSNPNISVLSSPVCEFSDDENINTNITRKVPVKKELGKFITRRNPMNHMAVLFRKSHVINSGGYLELHFMEDYYLWVRMFAMGYTLDNLDFPLVYARVGNGMLGRRAGLKYAKSELIMLFELHRLGVYRFPSTLLTFLSRAIFRLMPQKVINFTYYLIRK